MEMIGIFILIAIPGQVFGSNVSAVISSPMERSFEWRPQKRPIKNLFEVLVIMNGEDESVLAVKRPNENWSLPTVQAVYYKSQEELADIIEREASELAGVFSEYMDQFARIIKEDESGEKKMYRIHRVSYMRTLRYWLADRESPERYFRAIEPEERMWISIPQGTEFFREINIVYSLCLGRVAGPPHAETTSVLSESVIPSIAIPRFGLFATDVRRVSNISPKLSESTGSNMVVDEAEITNEKEQMLESQQATENIIEELKIDELDRSSISVKTAPIFKEDNVGDGQQPEECSFRSDVFQRQGEIGEATLRKISQSAHGLTQWEEKGGSDASEIVGASGKNENLKGMLETENEQFGEIEWDGKIGWQDKLDNPQSSAVSNKLQKRIRKIDNSEECATLSVWGRAEKLGSMFHTENEECSIKRYDGSQKSSGKNGDCSDPPNRPNEPALSDSRSGCY